MVPAYVHTFVAVGGGYKRQTKIQCWGPPLSPLHGYFFFPFLFILFSNPFSTFGNVEAVLTG